VRSGEDVAGRPGLVVSPTSGGISVEENKADDVDSDEDSASAVLPVGASADGGGGSAIVDPECVSRRYMIADATVEQRTFGRDNRGKARASIRSGLNENNECHGHMDSPRKKTKAELEVIRAA